MGLGGENTGYGWVVASPGKWKYFEGSLHPLGTFSHPGAGGAVLWIDRDHELVGSCFGVTTRVTKDYESWGTSSECDHRGGGRLIAPRLRRRCGIDSSKLLKDS